MKNSISQKQYVGNYLMLAIYILLEFYLHFPIYRVTLKASPQEMTVVKTLKSGMLVFKRTYHILELHSNRLLVARQ